MNRDEHFVLLNGKASNIIIFSTVDKYKFLKNVCVKWIDLTFI